MKRILRIAFFSDSVKVKKFIPWEVSIWQIRQANNLATIN